MIILGIDPGTATTGYGVMRYIGPKKTNKRGPSKKKRGQKAAFSYLAHGTIKTDASLSSGQRLRRIYRELLGLIREWQPEVLAIERVYFFKNLKTAMPLAQAKGVILLAAAQKRVPVYEVTPLQTKMAVTGYGRADKKQVQKMVQTLLNLKELPQPDDAADALGAAICCALSWGKNP